MTSSNENAGLPSYSESQALTEQTGIHHPTDIDNNGYEEDQRPLPAGWIRQWDSTTQNYFYVDTTANPPRSVWEHPDDLTEEQHSTPIAASTQKENPEAKVLPVPEDEDINQSYQTAAPDRHISLLGRSDFILPARREKRSWDHPDDLIEEQYSPYSAAYTRKEKSEAKALPVPEDEDINQRYQTAAPDQHTSLLGQSDFVLPARRRKSRGPIGRLWRLIFGNHPGSSAGTDYSSVRRVSAPAPPTKPMSRCARRRAERRARTWERREQYLAAFEATRESHRSRDWCGSQTRGCGSQRRGCCSRSYC